MDNGIAFITGRLSRDPQFFGEGDKRRAVFAIAYNRGRGERRKSTFVDCIAWGRMADFMQSFNKGVGISVHGDLEMDTWEKDGQKRSRLQLNISSITATTSFGDAPDSNTNDGASASSGTEVTIGGSDDSAEIPF
jgi:single-strand DNA-binding protein